MLALGEKLKKFRLARRFAEDNAKLNQAELYDRARSIESPPPGKRRGVCFPRSNSSASKQAERIRQFESGDVRPTQPQIDLLEDALGIPRGSLLEDYENETQIEEFVDILPPLPSTYTLEKRATGTIGTTGASLGVDQSGRIDDHLEGITYLRKPRIHSRNQRIIEKISQFLENRRYDEFSIVCLSGYSGVGKSRLLSDWYYSIDQNRARPRVVAVSASGLNSSVLMTSVFSRLCGVSTEKMSTPTAERIRASGDVILIIDGLVALEPNENNPNANQREHKHFNQNIRNFAEWLNQRNLPVSVILSCQTSTPALDPLNIESVLNPTGKFLGVELEPFNTEEAIELA